MIANFTAANKQQEFLEKLDELWWYLFEYSEDDDQLKELVEECREKIENDLKSFYTRELKAYDKAYPTTNHQESPLIKLPYIKGDGVDKHGFKQKDIY